MVAAQCNSKRFKLPETSGLGGDGDDVYPDSHDSPVRSFDTLRRSHVNCSSSHTTLLHWNQIACELRLIANECSGSGHHSSVAHTYDAKVPNTRRRTNITIVTCEGARVRVVRVRRKREVREQQNGHITVCSSLFLGFPSDCHWFGGRFVSPMYPKAILSTSPVGSMTNCVSGRRSTVDYHIRGHARTLK